MCGGRARAGARRPNKLGSRGVIVSGTALQPSVLRIVTTTHLPTYMPRDDTK